MRRPYLCLLALSAAIAAPVAVAAQWQTVLTSQGERVEIDKSRTLRTAPGKTTAWTRLVLGYERNDGAGDYSAVQAMNRYDCAGNRFVTLKRVYTLGDRVVREENVASPRELTAEPGSTDERLLTEACKLRTVGEAKQVADQAALAAVAQGAAPGVVYADVRKLEDPAKPAIVPVADSVSTKSEAPAEMKPEVRPPSERPRFIDLPKMDKSQLEPAARTTEADRAAVTGKKPAPMASSAESGGRQARERQLATSGPGRPARTAAYRPAQIDHPVHWGYEGEGAPANWAKLRPDYNLCASGRRQSPIDIREGIRVDLEPIRFDYKPVAATIVDNGHTLQVNLAEGSSIGVLGRNYRLVQFHFHRPSEERINGRGYDMDVHLVHRDDQGRIAMVAVLLEKGAEHPLVQAVWNHMPLERNQDVAPPFAVDPAQLLPETRSYFTYMGSLTTPPCSEDVLWMVLKQPVAISAEQIAIFSRLYRNNARPLQPSNERLIKESR